VAVDLDPLSLLSRLAASVPALRLHTVRYAGVLASASKLRARLAPKPWVPPKPTADVPESPPRGGYRRWAELLKRTFGFDVLTCPCCGGRMKPLALVTEPTSVARYLRGIGEPTDVPKRTPARGPLRSAFRHHRAEPSTSSSVRSRLACAQRLSASPRRTLREVFLGRDGRVPTPFGITAPTTIAAGPRPTGVPCVPNAFRHHRDVVGTSSTKTRSPSEGPCARRLSASGG
jgi:hypothetical protein